MSVVQLTLSIAILEGMTGIAAGATGIIVKRRVARRAFRVQGPVALPHLRVARIGESHAAGGSIPV